MKIGSSLLDVRLFSASSVSLFYILHGRNLRHCKATTVCIMKPSFLIDSGKLVGAQKPSVVSVIIGGRARDGRHELPVPDGIQSFQIGR